MHLDRVGFPPVSQPDIQSKPVVDFPIVLDIRLDRDQPLGAIGVRSAVRRSRELEGITR
jgi:hypothetical protein